MPSKLPRFATHQQHPRSSSSSSILSNYWRLLFQCTGHPKRSYLICITIIFYTLGAFYAFTLYYDKVESSSQQSHFFDSKNKIHLRDNQNLYSHTFKINENIKRVLFWTKFYTGDTLNDYCVRPGSLNNCPYKKCEFTMDKGLLDSSDAVVFHGRDLRGTTKMKGSSDKYIKMPLYRSEYQYWIFLMFEAPVHTWISLKPFDNIFNMTMTYRPDSDIHIPYGRVTPVQNPKDFQSSFQSNKEDGGHGSEFSENSTKEKRLAAWSVSNCYKTPSRRNEVVHELHKYIPIDIYGACGSFNCTPYMSLCDSGLLCHEYLGKLYKFYLAFENSLCDSYITEKFYDSLYFGMVPVVYGGTGKDDYSKVAPKGSYIDASAFPSMKSLAEYLLFLDKNPDEYEKYFQWKKHYRVHVSYFDDAWCALCTKLWTSTITKKSSVSVSTTIKKGEGDDGQLSFYNYTSNGQNTIENLRTVDVERRQVKNLTHWWYHSPNMKDETCINPTQLNWDSTMFSFYGFIYYPNYIVKVCILNVLVALLFVLSIVCCVRYVRNRNRLINVQIIRGK